MYEACGPFGAGGVMLAGRIPPPLGV